MNIRSLPAHAVDVSHDLVVCEVPQLCFTETWIDIATKLPGCCKCISLAKRQYRRAAGVAIYERFDGITLLPRSVLYQLNSLPQFVLALMLGAASAGKDDADDDSFSIGLGVLSPSYRQKIGPDGNTKVDFNQEKDGFSFSVSSGEPNAKTASGAVKPYSHITFSQQFQDPAAAKKHASAGGAELQQVAQHQPAQYAGQQGPYAGGLAQYGGAPTPAVQYAAAPQSTGYGGGNSLASFGGAGYGGAAQTLGGVLNSDQNAALAAVQQVLNAERQRQHTAPQAQAYTAPQAQAYAAPQAQAYAAPQAQGYAAPQAQAYAAPQAQAYGAPQGFSLPQHLFAAAPQPSYATPQQSYGAQQQQQPTYSAGVHGSGQALAFAYGGGGAPGAAAGYAGGYQPHGGYAGGPVAADTGSDPKYGAQIFGPAQVYVPPPGAAGQGYGAGAATQGGYNGGSAAASYNGGGAANAHQGVALQTGPGGVITGAALQGYGGSSAGAGLQAYGGGSSAGGALQGYGAAFQGYGAGSSGAQGVTYSPSAAYGGAQLAGQGAPGVHYASGSTLRLQAAPYAAALTAGQDARSAGGYTARPGGYGAASSAQVTAYGPPAQSGYKHKK
ncbi:hypothetical protein HPB51_002638 [Rhipicephalus microplus]|uniref:Uncharacterized protein n=1 Tax=Rhipicephalus microplus TaxID=6941 RepID=A0A9J6DFH4_RHIMP|nr:hypothetical protein HPB51_002638 [Rhipicephalus microplus]